MNFGVRVDEVRKNSERLGKGSNSCSEAFFFMRGFDLPEKNFLAVRIKS